jgi:hypothetical protein
VPVTVTAVAFVAATVNMDELPEVIEAGLAAMFTVGVAVDVLLKLAPPHPVKTRRSGNMNTIAKGKDILLRDRWAHAFIEVFLLISLSEQTPACLIVRLQNQHDTKQEKLAAGSALYRNGLYSTDNVCSLAARVNSQFCRGKGESAKGGRRTGFTLDVL